MRAALGLCAAAIIATSSESRPISLLSRHGDLSVQSPKNLIFKPGKSVGVNTNAPEELLHVEGNIGISGGLKIASRRTIRGCDNSSVGLFATPSDIMSVARPLRSFYVCDGSNWMPVGEPVQQDPLVDDCKLHPHWGKQSEFEMYVTNDITGAPEKIQCHSDTHMTEPPNIFLYGDAVIEVDVGEAYVEPGVTVTDPDRGSLPNAPVQETGIIDTSQPGRYYRQYIAFDSAGHASLPIVRTIVVKPPAWDAAAVILNSTWAATAGAVYSSCADAMAQGNTVSGAYAVDPMATGSAFLVYCDQMTDGGGWYKLKLGASSFAADAANSTTFSADFDNARVAMWQWGPEDTWAKCNDDAAEFYRGVSGNPRDLSVVPITSTGFTDHSYALKYEFCLQRRIDTREGDYVCADDATLELTWVQLNAIRGTVTELAGSTRLIATTADDDHHHGMEDEGGHEVMVYNEQNEALSLTPGHDGDCGGASHPGDTTAPMGSTGHRMWHTTAALTRVQGVQSICYASNQLSCNGVDGDIGPLPRSFMLPSRIHAHVSTGGGASFGFEQPYVLVR